jgi:catechol 2,3-dioxygenase-like lactoylglutathione lyase family enzyme
MGKVTSLGHVGIFVNDYPMMRDFYTRVLRFTITDEDESFPWVFRSAYRPLA